MIEEGDASPEIDLPAESGERFRLGGHRGRWVVVFFYPKDDTGGCTKEAVSYSEALSKFADAGVDVVGISPDSVASHEKFRTKHGLTVPLASDEDKTVLDAYGVWTEKQMYGRKYMGVERTTVLIDPKGKIAKLWRKVKVPGHVDEVLEAARTLSQ